MNRWVLWTACAVIGLGLLPRTASAQVVQPGDAIAGWFQKYLGRQPSPQAVNFWTNQMRMGMSPNRVRANILGSDDYFAANNRSDEGFMVGLFRDVAGRPTSISEVRHQITRLREMKGQPHRLRRGFPRPHPSAASSIRSLHGTRTPYTPVVVGPTVLVPVQPVVIVPNPAQPQGRAAPVVPLAPRVNPFR